MKLSVFSIWWSAERTNNKGSSLSFKLFEIKVANAIAGHVLLPKGSSKINLGLIFIDPVSYTHLTLPTR